MPVFSKPAPPSSSPAPALSSIGTSSPLHTTSIPHPRISTYNANSISAYHNTEASDSRFNRIVANINALSFVSDVILIQEPHLHHDDTHTLSSILPTWHAIYSNKSNGTAGAITLISPKLLLTHLPAPLPIDPETKGHVLPVLLTPRHLGDHTILILNLYLATGKKHPARLAAQLRSASSLTPADYNFAGGDFNFVEDAIDTAGGTPHRLPVYAKAEWEKFLSHFRLSEAAQPIHTYYHISSTITSSRSSRLDRIYHSYSEADLSLFQPLSYLPTIPFSILTAYYSLDLTEQSAARSAETSELTELRKGRSASDHLPLTLCFINLAPSKGEKRPSLSPTTARKPAFETMFRAAWKHNPAATPFQESARFTSALYTTARATEMLDDHTTAELHTKLEKITASITALRHLTARPVAYDKLEALIEKSPFLVEVCSLEVLADVAEQKVRSYVMDLFATTTPADTDTSTNTDPWHTVWTSESTSDPFEPDLASLPHPPTTTSKNPPSPPRRNRKCIATQLKARLPSTRTRLRALRANLSSDPTSDPQAMAELAAGFWGPIWAPWSGKDPGAWLDGYRNRIVGGKDLPLPTSLHFEQAISSTNDSAPGPDGVPYVAYRVLCDLAGFVLRNVLVALAGGASPPPGFNDGNLYLLPKKDTLLPTDTRPLAVNNCENRIIARVASLVIIPSLKLHLHPEQKGFIPGRVGGDHIEQLTDEFYSRAAGLSPGGDSHILSIDSRKAFDSISVAFLHAVLKKIGLPAWLSTLVLGLYERARVTPVFGPCPTGVWVDLKRGVRQGCPLSPLLFAIVMDPLVEQLRELPGVRCFAFADDLAFSARYLHQLAPVMRLIDAFTEVSGLGINTDKTVLVSAGDLAPSVAWVKRESPWSDLQVCDRCLYLGVLIGDITTADIFRVAMGKVRDRSRSYYPITRTLSVQRRIHLFNIFILPLLYYLMAFYILPEIYRKEIECIMRRMVVPFRTGFRLVHLYQPRARVAPQTALKDPWVVNAALLGEKGDFKAWHGAARAPKLGTESLLISNQILASVTDTVKWELGYGGKDGAGFATFDADRYYMPLPQPQRSLIYRSLSLARANYDRVDDDITSKLANYDITDIPASTLNTHFRSLLPKLNSHQRHIQFSLLFNSLPTDRRLAPVRRGIAARAAAQAAPPVATCALPPRRRSSRLKTTAQPSCTDPPPAPPPPHPSATRQSQRVRQARDQAVAARAAAEFEAVQLAEAASALEASQLEPPTPLLDGPPAIPALCVDSCYLGCGAEDSVRHLYGECAVVGDAWSRVCTVAGYPSTPAELGAATRIQVSLLAFPFVGVPLTHLIVAFNWAVWMDTRRFFKTLGYPPDHASAVARLATSAITAWLLRAKAEWHRPLGELALARFGAVAAPSHLSNAYGSAGTRTPEQQANCVAYTKHVLACIPDTALVAYTDGSAIPNPGPCGAGFSVWRGSTIVAEGSYALGDGSNNIGEFCAVGIVSRQILASPSLLLDSPAVFILSDSKLAVDGILGRAWVKSLDHLTRLVIGHFNDLGEATPVRLIWIPGHVQTDGNDRADARAKEGAVASMGLLACHLPLVDPSVNSPLPPLLLPPFDFLPTPPSDGPWATLQSDTIDYSYPPFPAPT
jgi:ribonuclease HI